MISPLLGSAQPAAVRGRQQLYVYIGHCRMVVKPFAIRCTDWRNYAGISDCNVRLSAVTKALISAGSAGQIIGPGKFARFATCAALPGHRQLPAGPIPVGQAAELWS